MHELAEAGMMDRHNDVEALARLLNDGWGYHDKDSERLAGELETAAETAIAASALTAFLHLGVHTIGEHLGDWERALRLGRRVLDGRTAVPGTGRAWGWLYVAAVLAGDALEAADAELLYLQTAGDDFSAALLDMRFMLAGALVGSRRAGEAGRIYRSAVGLVERVQETALLDRTIAMASNNLGWELYEAPSRTADEDALMQLAAATSLAFWRKCGNWINEERGLYLLARVANVGGDAEAGLAHANAAIALIKANGERPLDAALLHLARAASLGALGDADGRRRALADADAAAAVLTAASLEAQFAAERAKLVGDEA
jgi:hypothetical protein